MSRIPLKNLSPSSIDVWRECPRRYACAQGLIAVSPASIEASKQQTYPQVLGTTVHKVLESLLKLEPQQRTSETIQRTIEWTVMRFSRKAGLDQATLEHLRGETESLVIGYLAADGATATPIAVERSFSLSLSNGTTIATRVDRLDRRGNGEDDTSPSYEIVDYKTSYPASQLEARDLAYETAPIVQLHAVSRATGAPVERVTWVYLRSGESVTWWPEEEDVDSATTRLLKTVRTLQADHDFDPCPGAHCAYCPFARECPAGDHDALGEAA